MVAFDLKCRRFAVRLVAPFVALFVAPVAQAVSETPEAVSKGPEALASIATMVGGLLAVLAVIFISAWLVKRVGVFQGGRNQMLRILSALPLGQRERLLLVDADGTRMLLAVTANAITNLYVYGQANAVSGPASEFEQKLQDLMQADADNADRQEKDTSPPPAQEGH